MRRTPTGQRPQPNQSNSAGWSWSRPVPIQEQQGRASDPSRSSVHSPGTNPITADIGMPKPLSNKDAISFADKTDTKSPVTEPSIITTSADETITPERSERQLSDAIEESVSPISALDSGRPSAEDESMPGQFVNDSMDDGSNIPEQRDDGPSTENLGRQVAADEIPIATEPLAQEKHRSDTQDNEERSVATDTAAQPVDSLGTSASGDLEKLISVTASDHRAAAVDEQPTAQAIPIPSDLAEPIDDPSTDVSAEADPIRSNHSSDHSANVEDVSDEGTKPADVATAPVTASKDTPSSAVEPIPYYATPKIMVHKPSQSSQSEDSGPRTIDQVLTGQVNERRFSSPDEGVQATEPTSHRSSSSSSNSSVTPQVTRSLTGAAVHKRMAVKKRSLYLRKARNFAARKTILKMTLGRQLAVPTKEALRQLAHGEGVIEVAPLTTEAQPQF